MVLPNQRQHQHHQSIHLKVSGEKETDTQIEFDGSYPGSELMTETTHTEVCGIVILCLLNANIIITKIINNTMMQNDEPISEPILDVSMESEPVASTVKRSTMESLHVHDNVRHCVISL